jgi:hypothetical protein
LAVKWLNRKRLCLGLVAHCAANDKICVKDFWRKLCKPLGINGRKF